MTQTQWTNCIAVRTHWGRLPHICVYIYPMHIYTMHYVYTYIQCVYLETQCIYIYIWVCLLYLTDIQYIRQIFIISDRYSSYLTDIHYIWQIFIIFDRYSLYSTDIHYIWQIFHWQIFAGTSMLARLLAGMVHCLLACLCCWLVGSLTC